MGAANRYKKNNPEGRPGLPAHAVRRVGATAAVVLLLCLMAFCPAAMAKSKAFQEYQLKAVFLYHLTNFVAWPSELRASTDEPIRIVILGPNPFGDLLQKVVAGERVRGRPIIVEHHPSLTDLGPCQIVFVSSSLSDQLPHLVADVRNTGALIVGDIEGFARRGGDVNLLRKGNRITIEINVQGARRAGFGFSSKLLRMARIVEPASLQEVE